MATETKRRRGTTAQHAAFTGAIGEVTLDTDRDALVLHDGVTLGGFAIPNAFELQKQSFMAAVGGGTGDVVTLTLAPVPAGYTIFEKIKWQQPADNTGAVTINKNGLGAKAIKKNVSEALEAGDLLEDGIYEATYDGTNYQLAQSVGTGGGLILLDFQDLSAAAVADFTGLSAADFIGYKLKGWARPATDGVRPIIQYSEAASFVTTGYAGQHLDNTPTWVGASADGSLLPGGTNPLSVGNDADNAFEFEFDFGDMDGTRRWSMYGWQTWIGSEVTGIQYGPTPARSKNDTSPIVDALRFKFHSGNIAACAIRFYGYAR